jgi:hypothetical protein
MGATSEQIARHIGDQRNELRENVSELKQRAAESMDWRTQVNTRPATMVGLAFGGGVLLGILSGGRESTPNPGSAIAPAGAFRENPFAAQLNQLKGALFAIAAAKLGTTIESILPGFQQEYQRAGAHVEHKGSS